MSIEVKIIEWLQGIGNTFTDYLFYIITFMGDELFFIVVAALLYWCYSKKFAFKLISVYLVCVASNTILKHIFRRTRPYDAYPSIRSIFEETGGYSFPSGHSSSISALSTLLSQNAQMGGQRPYKIMSAVGITITLLVMLSRVYLGQHYPTDVIMGGLLGVLLALVFSHIYGKIRKYAPHFWKVIVPVSLALSLILILSGAKDEKLIRALAGYASATLGYSLEGKYVAFAERTTLVKNLLKIAIGMTGTLILVLTPWLLSSLVSTTASLILNYVFYFLSGLFVTFLAPLIFKYTRLQNVAISPKCAS